MPKAGSSVSLDGLGLPMWLTLELTYRCPLHCPWCSNPLDFDRYGNELSTEEWKKVLRDGRRLGSLQLGFTGGEPMLRDDIEELVAEAENLGYYTNLITSGIGLTLDRLKAMKKAGLKQIQLSLQSSDRDITNKLVGADVYDQKLAIAHDIKAQGFPMVLNVPVCKQNIAQARDILKLAEELGVEYIEFANIQYYNWALLNRSELCDWGGTGLSVMEMPFTSDEFKSIASRARDDLQTLLRLPENYRILFMQGGAYAHFALLAITPAVFNYGFQAKNDSRVNTQPTYSIYLASLIFAWILRQGGVAVLEAVNRQKSRKLYALIDEDDFYFCQVAEADRSMVNVCFYLRDAALEALFLEKAEQAGLINLKGHGAAGGIRASLYNAMPVTGVEALTGFMRSFADTCRNREAGTSARTSRCCC